MEYNTQQPRMLIREYGRNVQRLVEYCLTLKNNEERNKVARYIIELMGQVNPHLKNVEEFRHKLWDHLFEISDFRLKVESPYPIPTKGSLHTRPKPLKYPKSKITHRHYGKNVETLIEKASGMKDKEMQQEFGKVIGNYMKLVYKNWNKENVSDEGIRADLEVMSQGAVKLPTDTNLDALSRAPITMPYKGKSSSSSGGKHNQPFRHGGHRNQHGKKKHHKFQKRRH